MKVFLIFILWICFSLRPTLAADSTTVESIMPSVKQPYIPPSDENEKNRLVQSINDYMNAPITNLQAHPAAAEFPGTVPASTPRITKTLSFAIPPIQPTINGQTFGRKGLGWQVTGLYAAPGEKIRITTIQPLSRDLSIEIRVGAHSDKLFKISKWKRFPSVVRVFKLNQTSLDIGNAFGGPLYVSVNTKTPRANAGEQINLKFENVVETPIFILGKTTQEEWLRLRDLSTAPWGELVGHSVRFTIPSEQLRQLDDPTPVLEWWDGVINMEDEVVSWPTRISPEWAVADNQISVGYLHSGYPVMFYTNYKAITELDRLKEKGDWGFFHEFGHNHQSKDWTFPGQTEMTVNFFSMYVMDQYVHLDKSKFHPALAPKDLLKKINDRLSDSSKQSPWDQLVPFYPLFDQYGAKALADTLGSYATHPIPKNWTLEQKQSEFIRRYSQNIQIDLSDYLKKDGYACLPELCKELKQLPAFDLDTWEQSFKNQYPEASQ